MDGIEILRHLKSDKELAKIPVFVFTNLMDQESKNKCLDLGAEYYFVKTDYHLDEFINKINKIVENKNKLDKKN